jgi:type III pantothenate kinase
VDLLIDIGNTRIKWATLDASGLGEQHAAAYTSWTREQFIEQVLQGARPGRVLVSNVGGARMASLVKDALEHRWSMTATFAETSAAACGVVNSYPDPSKLGVDRWLCLIAAHAMETRASCIVSVGTAMTIDALEANGVHLGGIIVPGPDLMISSLMKGTSDIQTKAAEGSIAAGFFANNTLGAVHQGAVNALAALTERAIESMRLNLHAEPAVILTGGACHRLGPLLASPYVVVPDLVLRGLAMLAAPQSSMIGLVLKQPRI